ncbi:hypothetical protein FCM35_KLT06379 [Carex littledalei]|uniref:Uncharacterized protein n=1 Tax=Carex littledalei TaxID=544730 RepID=A0A833QZU8_9POAL|nr:hypothetical protein FCM35_KLT06379 [Carex littledalei]
MQRGYFSSKDASWDSSKRAGWGTGIYQQGGNLKGMAFGYMHAEDPFHEEALDLLNTIRMYRLARANGETTKAHLFSDCKILVHVVTGNNLQDLPSWKASEGFSLHQTCI